MTRKAAFLCTSSGWGGLEINVLRLTGWLQSRDWDIELFLHRESPIELEAINSGFRVTPVSRYRKHLDLKAARELKRCLSQYRHTHLFVFDNRDLGVAGRVKAMGYKDIKIIYQQQMQIGVNKRDPVHTLRYSRIDRWISPLNWLKEEVIQKTRFPADKIRVIPLCIETDRFASNPITRDHARAKFGLQGDKPTVGIIGRIDRKKGQLQVLQAAQRLTEQGMSIEVLVLGDPTTDDPESLTYQEQLEAFSNDNNMNPYVHFRSAIKEVEFFYKAIDVFVMASHGETFGMVTIESMLSGTPVVGTNSSGTPELLGHGELGSLFEYENINDLHKCLNDVLNNKEQSQARAQKAQQISISQYSHLRECELFEKVYDEFIS